MSISPSVMQLSAPSMANQCTGFLRTCQKCGWKFRHFNIKVCPGCGEPRVRCQENAVPGYKRCRYHGGPSKYYIPGKALNGAKFPLVKLADKYVEMMRNQPLLTNRASIEIVRERVAELLERIDINEAPDRLAKIVEHWDKYKAAKKAGFEAEAIVQMAAIDYEVEKAYHDYASWRQMFEALDLDRKLVESETKIIKDVKAMLTAEDAYKLTAKLLGVITFTINAERDLSDEHKSSLLKRIGYEFTKVIGDGANSPTFDGPEGGGGESTDPGSGEVD